MITESQAIKDIQETTGASEAEARKIYEEKINELNQILESVKIIPELQKEIQNIKRSMRNLFAIMDSALPDKIVKQEAYRTAKELVK